MSSEEQRLTCVCALTVASPSASLVRRPAALAPLTSVCVSACPGSWRPLQAVRCRPLVCLLHFVDINAIDHRKGSYRVRQVRSIGAGPCARPTWLCIHARPQDRPPPPEDALADPWSQHASRGRPRAQRRTLPPKHSVGPTMAAPTPLEYCLSFQAWRFREARCRPQRTALATRGGGGTDGGLLGASRALARALCLRRKIVCLLYNSVEGTLN